VVIKVSIKKHYMLFQGAGEGKTGQGAVLNRALRANAGTLYGHQHLMHRHSKRKKKLPQASEWKDLRIIIVHKVLKADEPKIGKNRVAKLLRDRNLRGDPPKIFRHTIDSNHDQPVAPKSLIASLRKQAHPIKVWAADIAYI
jgi:hypothetical protein